MTTRHPNPRLAKIHRNYTVDEVARLFKLHQNTVREWIRQGLPTNDDRRPMLVLGRDLITYLNDRRSKRKQTCKPGEMYCVRCRAPRSPAGDMADYQPLTKTIGNLIGICPLCETVMHRCVNFRKLEAARGNLDVAIRRAKQRIDKSTSPSLNSDFDTGNGNDGNTQRE